MASASPDFWKKLEEKPLYIDQTDTLVDVNQEEIEQFYLPLAEMLLKKSHLSPRLMAGIAGPPGSGKTIFAAVLTEVINTINGTACSACIGLDGWHYPNAYLDKYNQTGTDETVLLRKIKGAPETYDSGAALSCLQRIKNGENVSFPIYSRELHDPVPDLGSVEPKHRIIIVEGNYLLLDEAPWKSFIPLFNISIFLDVETNGLLDGLRDRHLKGGKSIDFTEKHMLSVDLPNIIRVKTGFTSAHIIVHKANNRTITSIEGLEKPPR
jgi:putative kinase